MSSVNKQLPEGWETVIINPQTLEDCQKAVAQTKKSFETFKDLPEKLTNQPFKECRELVELVTELYHYGEQFIASAEDFVLNPKLSVEQKKEFVRNLYFFFEDSFIGYLNYAENVLFEAEKFTIKETE